MLREIQNVTQIPGELTRRWFQDKNFDLIVWQQTAGQLQAFQLCYDRMRDERVLTWSIEKGFEHAGIDSGEDDPMHNRAPILVADGVFSSAKIASAFGEVCGAIAPDIARFVLDKILTYPGASS